MDAFRPTGTFGPSGPPTPRRYTRFRVAAYADITGEDVLLFHRIDEVSAGGMSYHCPRPLDPGSRVEAVLNFPQTGGALWLTGRVVWVKQLRDGARMGVEWLGLEESDRRELLRHVGGARTGTVGRPVRVPYRRPPLSWK